jgi:hypothetical protein
LGRRRCGGDQRDVVSAKRSVDERFLRVVGRLQDVIAHKAERFAKIEAGLGQVTNQCCRERAVPAVAIGRNRTGLGGEGDHRVWCRRLDLGQTTPDRA